MNDLSGEWTPIATYSGTFDGNGNTISGLTINATAATAGNSDCSRIDHWKSGMWASLA